VSIGQFTLSGRETKEIQVRLDNLPVQSIGKPSLFRLEGSYTTSTRTNVSLGLTEGIHVQFAPDYAEAYASMDSVWAVIALGLAGGDEFSLEYAQLRDDPVSTVKVTDSVGVSDEIDATMANELWQSITWPQLLPSGRYLDETGQFVDVPAGTVSIGMPAPHDQQVRDLEKALAPFVDDLMGDDRSVRGPALVCADFLVQYDDSGLGEAYLNGPPKQKQRYPARYASAEILYHPSGNQFWSGRLDINGCTTLTLPLGMLRFRFGEDIETPDGVNFYQERYEYGNLFGLWLTEPFFAEPSLTMYSFESFSNQFDILRANTYAVAAHTFVTPDSGHTPHRSYKLNVSKGTCGGYGAVSNAGETCFGYEPNVVPHTAQSKMTIAHEIGHSIQRNGAGVVKARYSVTSTEPLCKCDHDPAFQGGRTGHCLQSREHGSDAWEEGFAHFYAAKLFNNPFVNDCVVGYYGHVMVPTPYPRPGVRIIEPPAVVSCRNPVKWMKTHCLGQYYRPTSDGVEWDWMTFFWNIHGPSSYGSKRTTMSDYYGIKKAICGEGPYNLCPESVVAADKSKYSALESAALAYFGGSPSNAKFLHLVQMATDHGVK